MLSALTLALALSWTGDAGFVEGVRLYKATEYEQAIVQFQQLLKREDPTTTQSAADKAEALLWLGLSYAGSGDLDTARLTLRQALATDPTIALPPQTSPAMVALWDELRGELRGDLPAPTPVAGPVTVPAPVPAPAAPIVHPESAAGPGSLVVVGGAVAAAGAVALVGGGVLAVVASASLQNAQDIEQFQQDAKASLDNANAQALGASVLLPLGVVLGVGGVLLAMSGE